MSEEEIIKELKHKIKVNEKSRRKMQQSLMKEIKRLEEENERYRIAINEMAITICKAMEYIQDRYDGEILTHTFDKDNVKELLDILKGSDKE